MGSDDFEPCVGWVKRLADIKSNQCCIVPGEKILGAFLELPVRSLTQLLVSFLSQFIATPVDHVKR